MKLRFKSKRPLSLIVGLSTFVFSPVLSALAAPGNLSLSAENFVRLRCSTDSSTVFTEWSGSVYGFIPGQPHRELFHIVGMNAARCIKDAHGQWFLTSRELTYYLDPVTEKILKVWKNPFTNENVKVVHVANNPVQSPMPSYMYATKDGNFLTAQFDVNLTYPNALANDARFADFGNQALYQATELFKLTTTEAALNDPKLSSLPLNISWDRFGPWLPWMKMKGVAGNLIYSARGSKVAKLSDLPMILKQEINSRMPMYGAAPRCILAARNETSWSYFANHFQEYLDGAEFPLAAPIVEENCAN